MADWQRVKSIFQELIELPGEQRDAALDGLCAGDSELRSAVLRLLSANDQAGAFMGAPTMKHGDMGAAQAAQADPVALPPRIDHYTPLEVIGEGGFGTVYRARQDQPVRRIVALKVIKPGMDTREVIARFESERQALAMMSHANIASVLDAGATGEGRPYFVMEYVPGDPITKYCDKQRLQLTERLQLFIQVCQAIQHAHQKGVIHRDIKPSNVLVLPKDEYGRAPGCAQDDHTGSSMAVAKVIDFGVAKATDQRLTDHSMLTQEGMLVGTPEYMSPEQAEPGEIDIDTRTDIYALGVLLYDLLTGTLPFSSKTLRSKGLAEIQRIVREVDPPRPSLRLSTLLGVGERGPESASPGPSSSTDPESPQVHTDSATSIARFRRTQPRVLIRHLRGDLDWIVMKCLDKDRGRRYETANGLAAEVRRYLDDEPVVAGPPGTGYRLRKFARRNRTAIVAVAATAAALIVGLALSIVGFATAVKARNAADEQRKLAVRAADTAEAVNEFLRDMLAEADPRYGTRRDISVREALDRAVARLDAGSMKDQPEIEAAIRLTVGRTYTGLAQFAAAELQIEAALRAYRSLTGKESSEYAHALHLRGTVRKLAGRPAEAELDFRAALAIQQAWGEAGAVAAADCANDLALTLLDQRRFDEAEPLLREVLAFGRLRENEDEPIRGEAVNNMGSLHLARGEFALAAPLFSEAIDVNCRILGDSHPNIATNLDNLAQALQGKSDLDGALRAYREALAMRRELFADDHPELATTLHNLAVLHYVRGERDACEQALRESLTIFRRAHGLAHADTLTVVDSLVSVVGAAKRWDEAERLLLEAFNAVRDEPSISRERKVALAARLRQLYAAWNKPEEAREWADRAQALQTFRPPTQPAETAPAESDPSN